MGDHQKQMRTEYLQRIAFVQNDMSAAVTLKTFFNCWCEWVRAEKFHRTYTKQIQKASQERAEELENAEKAKKLRDIQLSSMKDYLGGMVFAWGEKHAKMELEYLWKVWK